MMRFIEFYSSATETGSDILSIEQAEARQIEIKNLCALRASAPKRCLITQMKTKKNRQNLAVFCSSNNLQKAN